MDKAVTRLEAIDIEMVLKMLPHRYPFLMVDRVVDIQGDESGIGIKNVTINEPQFQGHFPGNTIEYHMKRIARRKSMWWYRGEAKVAGQVVAEAQVGAMLSDA
jgi:3-hydroxyacyl-[acyl-carrier-protein] dehydratase